ncbi:hypothetical protein [Streptomyces sp. NPDC054783]
MELIMLYKDTASGGGGCPSVYLAESGEFVVQGPKVDASTHANLANVLPGEDAVRISVDVVLGAVAEYQARQGGQQV